jgi:putative MATE family efflux protein
MTDRPRRASIADLLEGPIALTLLRLAAPTFVVVLMQATVNVVETYFVGRLGTDALAGVSLVFPALMLMTMMAAGGMGGAVASAIGRALGAGRHDEAQAIVAHALAIAFALGMTFTGTMLSGAPALYRLMGGNGSALESALAYSNTIFAASVLFWMLNALSSILRGTGNMIAPAVVSVAGAALLIPLSPALIFGWGPLPQMGIAGGAWALVTYYLSATVALLVYLRSGRALVTIEFRGIRFEWRHFADILGVGAISSLMTLQSNLMVMVTTGLVGSFGTALIAGYGVAARLDYLLVPVLFALGTAAVTLVATSIGAGKVARAARTAWIAASIGGAITELIGVVVAFAPHIWMGAFSSDSEVLASGGAYLRIVGPFYGFMGAGLLMFFASQGAGQMRWPFIAGILRFVVVMMGGPLVVAMGAGVSSLFIVIALSLLIFGVVNVSALRFGTWRRSEIPSPRPLESATATGASE